MLYGTSPMGMLKKGHDASSRAVKNNVLKRTHRNYDRPKDKKVKKLRTSKNFKSKANSLKRKGERAHLSWDPLLWTVVASLFLIAFFYNYWWVIILALMALAVIAKIIFEVGAVVSKKSTPVSQEMRKAKIARPKKMKKPLNPADYYVI